MWWILDTQLEERKYYIFLCFLFGLMGLLIEIFVKYSMGNVWCNYNVWNVACISGIFTQNILIPSVCLSICLCICPSILLFYFPSVCPSICLSVHPSFLTHFGVHKLWVHVSGTRDFMHVCVGTYVHLSVCVWLQACSYAHMSACVCLSVHASTYVLIHACFTAWLSSFL